MQVKFDNTVKASDFQGGPRAELPEGVEHGSFAAVMRYGCGCRKCQNRAARARKHGWRPRA